MILSLEGKLKLRNERGVKLTQDETLVLDDAIPLAVSNELFINEFQGVVLVAEVAFDQVNSRESTISQTLYKPEVTYRYILARMDMFSVDRLQL